MKTLSAMLLALTLLSFSMSTDRFKPLLTLEGTWVMQTRKGPLFEHWDKISDVELQSKSYRLNGKDTVLLEKVRLVEKEGNILYIPVVENQNNRQPVEFRLISVEKSKFTFENKQHDFPQRIIYNIVSGDSIIARIEGEKKGVVSGSDFYFKRYN
jgi:hypothetical protein